MSGESAYKVLLVPCDQTESDPHWHPDLAWILSADSREPRNGPFKVLAEIGADQKIRLTEWLMDLPAETL